MFEGGEGAGKSTQVEYYRDALAAQGREVVVTRAGETPAAEAIRSPALDPRIRPRRGLRRCCSRRSCRYHAAALIRPAIDRGAIVICDRWASILPLRIKDLGGTWGPSESLNSVHGLRRICSPI